MITPRPRATVGPRRASRRTERGAVLAIALLLLLVLSFLAGIAFLIARGEAGHDTTLRNSATAFNAAEYALNLHISTYLANPDPAAADAACQATRGTGTVSIPGPWGVSGWSGTRNGFSYCPNLTDPVYQQGVPCPALSGFSGICMPRQFYATGQSTRFFVVTATTEVESLQSVATGCGIQGCF